MPSNWLDKQVSLYKCLADNSGRPATLREVLFSAFAEDHEWFFKDHRSDRWISDNFNDLTTMIDLRTQNPTREEKALLKATMQCFTPAGLLKTKKKGCIEEISRTGLMQLDFDYDAIMDYDIEELKLSVFDLPFVAFCGISCSGKGFYALVAIEEPHRLQEYAEHCFDVLKYHGIPPDTSKGRNVNDLRFVSYDCNMLWREDPKPLKITAFRKKQSTSAQTHQIPTIRHTNAFVDKYLRMVQEAQVGNRWATVQKVAFTLGGLQDYSILDRLKDCINASSQFTGQESKYTKCAEDCFNDGAMRPLPISA